jgi:NAD(P)H-hydrate repair Nnr-like enzyme with NAD(P)H-hydrate epimerase domain
VEAHLPREEEALVPAGRGGSGGDGAVALRLGLQRAAEWTARVMMVELPRLGR